METQYICEICRKSSETKSDIEACEKKGLFDETVYKAGLMKAYYHGDYVGIFALPSNVKTDINDKHGGYSGWWAIRDKKFPKNSLGDEKCGSNYFNQRDLDKWVLRNHIKDSDTKRPEFKQMVEYLKGQGINPHYYNEQLELVKL